MGRVYTYTKTDKGARHVEGECFNCALKIKATVPSEVFRLAAAHAIEASNSEPNGRAHQVTLTETTRYSITAV